MNPFNIVKDSSVWFNSGNLGAALQQDSNLYTGMVRSIMNDSETGELRYMVEVHYRGDTIPVACRMVRRFGGAFNYEDVVYRGYNYKTPTGLAAKAGDHVLVGFIGGQGREGVIIGGLTHPTRKNLSKSSGPEYKSEFNGIETYINKDGEYTLTFRAQPTNLAELDVQKIGPVPAPKYDTDIGSSFLKWDRTGSFLLSDNAKQDTQRFFVDKKNNAIFLGTEKISLKLDTKNELVNLGSSSAFLNLDSKNGKVNWTVGDVFMKMDKGPQSIDLKGQKYVLTSPDIKLGSSSVTEQAVFGTTYRMQEGTMNTQLGIAWTTLAGQLASLGALLTTAGGDPVLASLAPVAAASLISAGTLLTTTISAVTIPTFKAAIDAFEAGSSTYLSNVVKLG